MRTRMDGVHHKHRNLYETNARLYIKQRSQSSVLVKQAKKNSFKMLSRGEEHFFTRQPNARAVRLFLQFSFSM